MLSCEEIITIRDDCELYEVSIVADTALKLYGQVEDLAKAIAEQNPHFVFYNSRELTLQKVCTWCGKISPNNITGFNLPDHDESCKWAQAFTFAMKGRENNGI